LFLENLLTSLRYFIVAIQNWNSYMISLNSAITFASSIIGLIQIAIVTDFYPNLPDNITPLVSIEKAFTTVLGLALFTGYFSTVSNAVTQGLDFVTGQFKSPTATNLLARSNVATSLATVVQNHQSVVSSLIQNTFNTPVNATAGRHTSR
jgi:hypothetical protein